MTVVPLNPVPQPPVPTTQPIVMPVLKPARTGHHIRTDTRQAVDGTYKNDRTRDKSRQRRHRGSMVDILV